MNEQEPQRTPHKSESALFFEAYDAVVAPKNSVENPDDPQLQRDIDTYFEDILSALQLNYLIRTETVTRDVVRVSLETTDALDSYDEQHQLALRNLQSLATVEIAVRQGVVTAFTAHKAPLEAATQVTLDGYYEGDDLLTNILFRH